MKKKILIIMIYGVMIFGITGCIGPKNKLVKTNETPIENNVEENTLICTGPGFLSTDCYESSDGNKGCNISADGKVTYYFDDNGVFEHATFQETSREDVICEDETDDGFGIIKRDCTVEDFYKEYKDMCKEYSSMFTCDITKDDKKVTVKYDMTSTQFKNYFININSNDSNNDINKDFIIELMNNSEYEEMKYTCNNKNTSSNSQNKPKNTSQQLVCDSQDYYNNNDNVVYNGIFTFENDKVVKYEYILTVPNKYDPNEYYIEEEKSNMGQYEMSLDGRNITFKLTEDRAYWNDWKYKDKNIYEIKQEYEDEVTKCDIIEKKD